MASSKKQLQEGIVNKILNKLVSRRIDKAIDLFSKDPKMLRSLETIKKEKENLEKGLKKYPAVKDLLNKL